METLDVHGLDEQGNSVVTIHNVSSSTCFVSRSADRLRINRPTYAIPFLDALTSRLTTVSVLRREER